MQCHTAGIVIVDLQPALLHDAAATGVQDFQRCGNTVGRQHVALVRLDHGYGLMIGVSQIGNGTKGVFAIVRRRRVQQYITTRHAGFHFNDFFGLYLELAGHRLNLRGIQRIAVGAQVGRGVTALEALLHGSQVKEQLALRFGRRDLYHAPIFQNVFVDLCLDPVQRVTYQAHAVLGVEAFDCLHQANITFLDQVAVGQAVTQVLARHRYHQTQVREY